MCLILVVCVGAATFGSVLLQDAGQTRRVNIPEEPQRRGSVRITPPCASPRRRLTVIFM